MVVRSVSFYIRAIYYFLDLSDAQDKIESVTVNLQAMEKEKRILEISLKQRDSEIGRLTELNRFENFSLL